MGKRAVVAGFCLVLSACLLLTASARAAVIHVDAGATSGANDGSSWADAYVDLQDALAVAASGDEIWVAEGTCRPTDTGDRAVSFQLVEGVALYGGFAGTESLRDERNWTTHETVLSGDLLGDDDPAYPLDDPLRMNGENSYHVVVGADDATFDGFTVSGGNADGLFPDGIGAGMLNDNVSGLTVTNCCFSGNSAYYNGGGMRNSLSSPTVTGCTFWGNVACDGGAGMDNIGVPFPVVTHCTFVANDAYYGGGIANTSFGGSPTISSCTFLANTAFHGGGIKNDGPSPALADCTFVGNLASYGGAIYNQSSAGAITGCVFQGNAAGPSPYGWGGAVRNRDSSPSILDCEFSGNRAKHGGGIANAGASEPDVVACTFSGNAADSYGGGMENETGSSPLVSRCSFVGNTAAHGGGVAHRHYGSATIASCLFSANRALASTGQGGGIYHDSNGPLAATNCTFVGNSAETGGGVASNADGSCTVTGCILRDNRASTGADVWGSSSTVARSCIPQGAGFTDAGGNISLDPEFRDPGHWDDNDTPGDESDDFWVDPPDGGDYHLLPGSPCIDRADGDAAPEFDIEGNPRHDDPGMPNAGRGSPDYADIGAYEFQGRSEITPFGGGCVPSRGGVLAGAAASAVPALRLFLSLLALAVLAALARQRSPAFGRG